MKKRGILKIFVMLIIMSVALPACGGTDTETSVERTKRSERDSQDKDSKNEDTREKNSGKKSEKSSDTDDAADGDDTSIPVNNGKIVDGYDIKTVSGNLNEKLDYRFSLNSDGSLNVIFNDLAVIKLPKNWNGKVVAYERGDNVQFCHRQTDEAGGDGLLFTVCLYSSKETPPMPDVYWMADSSDGYSYYLYTPSDFRGDESDADLQKEYSKLFEENFDVIMSIHEFDPATDGQKADTDKKEASDKNKATDKRKVTDKDIKTTPSDTSKITYEKYKDPTGYFTMEIPKGWKVSTGGDAIHYFIAVYDPTNTDRRIYVQMLAEGFASDYANEYYKTWFGYDPGYLIIPDATVKGFFESFAGNSEVDPHARYYGFSFVDNLGILDSGAGIIQGTAYSENGNKIEMIATALVQTIADTSGLGLDVVYANGVCMLAAGESEFTDWVPILDKSVGTLSFTDSFWKQRNREWANVIKTTQYVSQKWNGVSDGIMSSWEKRTNSHDIIRQRESDATLGYDRVVDTQTGKIYRVDTGLMDGYSGSRYEILESGSSLYNEPVDGYITIK